VVASVVAIAVLAAACSSKASTAKTAATSAAPAGTIKIGISSPQSGQFSAAGNPFENGIRFAAQQINDGGGVTVAGKKYTVQVISVDDRGDQAAAVQAATQLINDDHVVALFGPIGPLGPSVADLAKTQNVLNFTSSSSVAAIAGPPKYPNVFVTVPTVDARVQAAVDAIKAYAPSAHSAAILAPDDETTKALGGKLTAAFQKAGLTVSTFTYPTGTTDLSTVLTRLAASKPDLLFSGWSAPDQKTQSSQFAAAGIPTTTTVLYYAGTIAQCKQIDPTRPCIAHPLAGSDLSSPTPTNAAKSFVSGYLAFSKSSALPANSTPLLWTYDFVYLLTQAMTQAGTVDDANKIADALRSGKVTRNGLVGQVGYGQNNFPSFGFDVSLVTPDGTVTTRHFG
jgi:branched-chain amino acid transport system substrate-binding protein